MAEFKCNDSFIIHENNSTSLFIDLHSDNNTREPGASSSSANALIDGFQNLSPSTTLGSSASDYIVSPVASSSNAHVLDSYFEVNHAVTNDDINDNCGNSNSGTCIRGGESSVSLKNRRKREIKDCMVCGDKALGFNFDAVTCESCKAFFRRNALKNDVPKCIFENHCKVDLNTRRFCTFCRLQKCLSVGMKKDMILNESARKERLQKVSVNRQKRGRVASFDVKPLSNEPVSVNSTDSAPLNCQNFGNQATEHEMQLVVDNLLSSATSSVGAVSSCDLLNSTQFGVSVANSSSTAQHSTDNQHLLNLAGGTQTQPPPSHATTSLPPSLVRLNQNPEVPARLLTQEEWSAVADLRTAYEHSFLDSQADKTPEGCVNVNSLVNTSGFIVKKLINFAKKLPDFTMLMQECQIGLLKGVVLGTLFLRSAMSYDPVEDVWVTPKGNVPTRILKDATGFEDLYEQHIAFCRGFKEIFLNDAYLIPLMQVLALFSPDRPSIADRQRVADIQDRYLCLLKHYLEARYNFGMSRSFLPRVLDKLQELHVLAESHGFVLLHVNPNEVEPLMLEVFDLKAMSGMFCMLGKGSSGLDIEAASEYFMNQFSSVAEPIFMQHNTAEGVTLAPSNNFGSHDMLTNDPQQMYMAQNASLSATSRTSLC